MLKIQQSTLFEPDNYISYFAQKFDVSELEQFFKIYLKSLSVFFYTIDMFRLTSYTK